MAGNENSGRKSLPIGHHLDAGTYRGDKHGPIPDGAEGEPVPSCRLTGAARKWWEKHVPDLVARGVAKAIDGPALEAMAGCWALYKAAEKAALKEPTDGATRGAVAAYLTQLNTIGKRFGWTFGDRQKIRLKPREKAAGVESRRRA